ncbi:hypothetical protein KIPB_013374, partial [Kipferlia bialata]|eukprot:g13374.t1
MVNWAAIDDDDDSFDDDEYLNDATLDSVLNNRAKELQEEARIDKLKMERGHGTYIEVTEQNFLDTVIKSPQ